MKILGEDIVVIDAIFVSAVIICSMFAYIFITPRPVQPIFPLWILNEYQKAPKSEMTVLTNKSYLLYLGAENRMQRAEYCKILVKFRNLSMPIPSTANSTAAPLDPILNYRFFLAKDEEWKESFQFKITGEGIEDLFLVHNMEINDQLYQTNLRSRWSEEFEGFYYQFIFELWLFNKTKEDFTFSSVWVSSPFLYMSLEG